MLVRGGWGRVYDDQGQVGEGGLAKEPLNPIYPFGISGNLDMWQK